MTATYDQTLPAALDRVRFTVGDTIVGLDTQGNEQAIKPDEEYLAILDAAASESEAIALVAEALATQMMQDPDSYSESGGISVSWSSRIKTWLALAESYRARSSVAVSSYGATMSHKPNRDCDLDPEYRRSYLHFWNRGRDRREGS
jgi:hypothetical protein